MKLKTQAEFVISGFRFLPDRLTKTIGLKPDIVWKKGDLTPKLKRLIMENSWSVTSDLDPNLGINEHLENLLSKLKPYKSKILEFTKKYKTLISITCLVIEGEEPSKKINQPLKSEVNEYNAKLDIDIYNYQNTSSNSKKEVKYKEHSKLRNRNYDSIFNNIRMYCVRCNNSRSRNDPNFYKHAFQYLNNIYLNSEHISDPKSAISHSSRYKVHKHSWQVADSQSNIQRAGLLNSLIDRNKTSSKVNLDNSLKNFYELFKSNFNYEISSSEMIKKRYYLVWIDIYKSKLKTILPKVLKEIKEEIEESV